MHKVRNLDLGYFYLEIEQTLRAIRAAKRVDNQAMADNINNANMNANLSLQQPPPQ